MEISVIIPVHNGERYLEECLDSVLAQTFGDFEVLVGDDCSTDGTAEILARRAATCDRLTVVRNDRNLRASGTRNRLIEAARGRFVAFIDADDICEPRRLELQHAYMVEHPDVGVVGSNFTVIDDDGAMRPTPRWYRDAFGPQAVRNGRVPVAQPTALVRTELFRTIGVYDKRFTIAEDFDLWSRFYARGVQFALIDEPLVRYRIHDMSSTDSRAHRQLRESIAINLTNIFRRRIRPSLRGVRFLLLQLGYLAYMSTGLDRIFRLHSRIRRTV